MGDVCGGEGGVALEGVGLGDDLCANSFRKDALEQRLIITRYERGGTVELAQEVVVSLKQLRDLAARRYGCGCFKGSKRCANALSAERAQVFDEFHGADVNERIVEQLNVTSSIQRAKQIPWPHASIAAEVGVPSLHEIISIGGEIEHGVGE